MATTQLFATSCPSSLLQQAAIEKKSSGFGQKPHVNKWPTTWYEISKIFRRSDTPTPPTGPPRSSLITITQFIGQPSGEGKDSLKEWEDEDDDDTASTRYESEDPALFDSFCSLSRSRQTSVETDVPEGDIDDIEEDEEAMMVTFDEQTDLNEVNVEQLSDLFFIDR